MRMRARRQQPWARETESGQRAIACSAFPDKNQTLAASSPTAVLCKLHSFSARPSTIWRSSGPPLFVGFMSHPPKLGERSEEFAQIALRRAEGPADRGYSQVQSMASAHGPSPQGGDVRGLIVAPAGEPFEA